MNRVGRFRADDVDKLDALFRQGLFHYICRLFLPVNFAAVSNRGTMPQVEAPARAVVPVPEPLFPPGWLQALLLKDLEKLRRLAEACARVSGEPAIGVVDGKLPRRSPAH